MLHQEESSLIVSVSSGACPRQRHCLHYSKKFEKHSKQVLWKAWQDHKDLPNTRDRLTENVRGHTDKQTLQAEKERG